MPNMPPDNQMADPMEAILKQMRTNPDDAAVIGQFLDIAVLVRVFREEKYDAETKIRTLINIAKTGTNTERMRATRMIDEIWDTALVRRGMLVGKGANLPAGLPNGPIGMPPVIQSIEATQTTRQVRMTMETGMKEVEPESTQPLKELPDDSEEKEIDDDQYFPDDRGTNPNIVHPPTIDHGQAAAIGNRFAPG